MGDRILPAKQDIFDFMGHKMLAKGEFVEVGSAENIIKEELEMELSSYVDRLECGAVPQPRNLEKKDNQHSGDAMADRKTGEESKRSSHAMVLIGGRHQDKTGEKWLLLQNWWDEMQLVAISDEYFEEAGAQLSFLVDKNLLKDASNLSLENCSATNGFRVAECNNLDRAETYMGLLHVTRCDRSPEQLC